MKTNIQFSKSSFEASPFLLAPKPSNLGGASTIPSTAKRHTSTGGRRHHFVKSRGDG